MRLLWAAKLLMAVLMLVEAGLVVRFFAAKDALISMPWMWSPACFRCGEEMRSSASNRTQSVVAARHTQPR